MSWGPHVPAAVLLIALAAPVAAQPSGAPSGAPVSVDVPRGDGAPVVTDGIFSQGEWDDALRIAVSEAVHLYVKEHRGVVFVGVCGQGTGKIGPSELYLAAPGGPIQQFHVSAQLFEGVLPRAGDGTPRFGLTTGWYANELRRDEAESERLRKEGRSPIDVMRESAYPSDGIEFAIRRSRLPGDRWLVRLWVSAIVGDEPGMVAFPAQSAERTTDGWLELRFAAQPADGRAVVERTIRDSIGWALTKDRTRLERIVAHDAALFIFNPESKPTVGWDEFVKNFEFWMDPRFRATSLDVRELHVTFSRSADVAWWSAMLDDLAEWDGKPVGWKDTRWTGVLEKRDGEWVIVQMHFSFAADRARAGVQAGAAAVKPGSSAGGW